MVYLLFFVLEHIPGLGDGVSPLSIGNQLAFTVAWSLKGLDSNLKKDELKCVKDAWAFLDKIGIRLKHSIQTWVNLTSG